MREHQVGPIALAICERVYRGSVGRNGKPRQQKLVPGSIPAALCTCVHACLLDETSNGKYWVATSHSLCLILDPHHESGLVLCELNSQHYMVKLSSHGLVVGLSAHATHALREVQGKGWAPGAGDGKATAAPIFTEDSFVPTKAGKAQICSYMNICRGLYKEVSGKELTDNQGHIRCFKDKASACWDEIVARSPAYFETTLRAKSAGGSQPTITAAQFSKAVWSKFGSTAPTRKNGVEPFLKFLKDIDRLAPKPLPVSVDAP